MENKEQLCKKIQELYPEVGECGIDIDLEYEDDKKAWMVKLSKDKHHLNTYLEPDDAKACLIGEKCVGLGFQISQLIQNIKEA
ncbi:MAG: hypothetical protein ABIF87_05970 [Pseudomonadota bacterium]